MVISLGEITVVDVLPNIGRVGAADTSRYGQHLHRTVDLISSEGVYGKKNWSKSDLSIAQTTWVTYRYIYLHTSIIRPSSDTMFDRLQWLISLRQSEMFRTKKGYSTFIVARVASNNICVGQTKVQYCTPLARQNGIRAIQWLTGCNG